VQLKESATATAAANGDTIKKKIKATKKNSKKS
jgi:hypothetical protein